MIEMKPFVDHIGTLGLGAEVIYSFVIILCSLMIYYGTKELYELSSYKGIKYFRQAFLFFALAYFFRSFIKVISISSDVRDLHEFAPMMFGEATLFIFAYFSSIAIFYLLYSVMWKTWNGSSKKVYLFHAISLIIALLCTLSRSPFVYVGLNVIILLFAGFTFYFANREQGMKHKKNSLYAIYLLLFAFWMLNVFDVLVPMFLEMFKLIIYLFSAGIFLLILYKVLKKSGSD